MREHKISPDVSLGEGRGKDSCFHSTGNGNSDEIKYDFQKLGVCTEAIIDESKISSGTKQKQISKSFGLLELSKANDVIIEASKMPDPILLFKNLIIQNEFSILFADTGIGKTILAMQSAIEIANQGHIVLFLDLELSEKQFQRRFTSEDGQLYKLPDTLYRARFSRSKKISEEEKYLDSFFTSLELALNETKAKILFVDNLTKLIGGSTDTSKDAIPILVSLNEIQQKYGLTIVVIEHNKKVSTTKIIELNDLQGSKMKANLVDSIFTIGRVQEDKYMRYIKQLKVRDGEAEYDTYNVQICEMSWKKGYLSFDFKDQRNEYDLIETSKGTKDELIARVHQLKESGYSNVKIAEIVGKSEGTIRNWLK
jgi:KaiC/GvpD/RAD55 family RecA-like ATPase